MIRYSRPKLSELYTLSQSKLLENHTVHSGTYLYSPYMAVATPSGVQSPLFFHKTVEIERFALRAAILVSNAPSLAWGSVFM